MKKAFLSIDNLHFAYGQEPVFSQLDLHLSEPQIAAIVGLNGSGKSTLFKLALGLLTPSAGQIQVLGEKPGSLASRRLVGAALQEIDFPPHEKVEEILNFVSQQFSVAEDPEDLIRDFFLQDFRSKSCQQLSGGMKRRLALACSLIGQPRLVLLDEPTTGLDLPSRRQLLKNLRIYQQKHGSLILMISHHPEEVFANVDIFLHTGRGQVQRIEAQEMGRLTRLKKVSYQAKRPLPWQNGKKFGRENSLHWLITEDADAFVQALCESGDYADLRVQPIGTEELLSEVL